MQHPLKAILLALPLALAENAVLTSSDHKRGLIYVHNEDPDDNHYWDSATTLSWYYNYEATPSNALDHTKLSFVPMLWQPGDNERDFYKNVKGLIDGGMNITYVLGFNEPDGCNNGGSCVDAETAAQAWIQQIEPLKDLGIKLGAPAVTGANDGFNWLQNFFTQCAGKCTPDFIPVHWYGNFEGFASHIGRVNATYENMTMWVTEYGYPDQSLEDTQDFYNQSNAFLERVPYITHYSYFGSFRSDVSNVGPDAAMLTQTGELTDIGAWYLGMDATGNIPKGGAVQAVAFTGWLLLVSATMLVAL